LVLEPAPDSRNFIRAMMKSVPTRPPLHDVKILALENYLAGNHVTWLLGMLGAEIIKVESVDGDVMRNVGAPIVGENGIRHAGELRLMGNKRSVVINMHSTKGRQIFLDLAAHVDVVFTNQKPSSLKRMNISFEILCEQNPKIIYSTLTGFGHDDVAPSGPCGAWPAFDLIAQGLSGIQFRAEGEGDRPGFNGLPIGDTYTATLCALGTLAALHARDMYDEPQRVDIAMHDAMVFTNEQAINIYALINRLGPRGRSAMSAPFGSFRTTDGWVNIAIGGDPVWKRFCRAVDMPELADDPRYRLSAARLERLHELDAIVEGWTKSQTTNEVVERLLKHLVPAAPVLTVPQVAQSAQVAARGMLAEIDDPIVGKRKVIGNPIKMHGLDGSSIRPPPLHGADTHQVLHEYLGIVGSEVDTLISEGVLGGNQGR
jgi:CoA:oxalate CoA-transferase